MSEKFYDIQAIPRKALPVEIGEVDDRVVDLIDQIVNSASLPIVNPQEGEVGLYVVGLIDGEPVKSGKIFVRCVKYDQDDDIFWTSFESELPIPTQWKTVAWPHGQPMPEVLSSLGRKIITV